MRHIIGVYDMNGKAKNVYIETDNIEFVKAFAEMDGRNFSNAINFLIRIAKKEIDKKEDRVSLHMAQ